MSQKTLPSNTRRSALRAATAALALGVLPLSGFAQGGAIRFVLPNAVGSGVDAITRAVQPALSRALGAPIVVDNQPGAGGVVGLQTLARSAPDGLTFSVVSNNVVIFPSVLKSLPFDMPGDFTPIAVLGTTPMVLVVNPTKVSATTSQEFVALLKSRPGQFNFASGGNGTILHLAAELYLKAAGASGSARHIPYRGVGPMVTALLGGEVEFGVAALPSVQGHIQSGALRAIGTLAPQRISAAPNIPTMAEQGLANFSVEAWFAVIGPKGLSAAQVKRMHDALVTAFDDPAVKDAMARMGNTIRISTPEAAQAAFRAELAKYAALVKKVGLEPQ